MEVWEYNDDIVGIILWIIIGLGLFIVFIKLFKKFRDIRLLKSVTSLSRGTKSERDLILRLLKYGIPAQTIFHDLCIEKDNGKFSQLDLVIATTQGIIVIEVKDYSGWIFGDANYTHWTKVLAYGKKKYRFYNPIKQNIGHIKALEKQGKQFENLPFFSIIVFYGDCKLKEINYVPKGTFLVKSPRVFEVLKFIKKNNEAAPYINKREVVNVLKQAVKNGESVSKQEKHLENIEDMLGKDRIYD